MQFDRLARNWENLAKQDPMWAILTDESRKGGRWDPEEFFATGRSTVEWLGSWLHLHGVPVPKGRALDFGCGLGRLTQALAPHFDHVLGVDASEAMVRGAREHNRHGSRVEYLHNLRPDLGAVPSDSIAFVLSAIVLQHMRTEYQLGYVREFVRVLRPGGLAFFQAPTGEILTGAIPNAGPDEPAGEARMEMHCMTKDEVRAAVEGAGGRVLLCEDDLWAGPNWTSAHYLVTKDARS